ncbi:MAG: hypothetical protein RL064_852, partial [Bacteroidota bacterium]
SQEKKAPILMLAEGITMQQEVIIIMLHQQVQIVL